MNRISRLLAAIALGTAALLLVGPVPAATAAKSAVTIKKISTKTAPYGKSVTVKPAVTVKGKAKVTGKTLTVKRGSVTVGKNKKTIKLKAGTYKVTTKVKYRTYKIIKKKNAKTKKIVSVRKYAKTKTLTKQQTLTIKQGKRPSRTSPKGWNCPSGAPIKGNAQSMIYHMPSGAYYTATKPEACFSTQAAARSAGYRASKR